MSFPYLMAALNRRIALAYLFIKRRLIFGPHGEECNGGCPVPKVIYAKTGQRVPKAPFCLYEPNGQKTTLYIYLPAKAYKRPKICKDFMPAFNLCLYISFRQN